MTVLLFKDLQIVIDVTKKIFEYDIQKFYCMLFCCIGAGKYS